MFEIKEYSTFLKMAAVFLFAVCASIVMLYLFKTPFSIMWSVLLISVLVGVLSIWWVFILPVCFVLATIIVPNEILPFLSGTNVMYGFGPVRLHPAALTLFVGSVLNIVLNHSKLKDRISESKELVLIIVMFIAFLGMITLQTLYFRGFQGIPQVLENYLFPFCFFIFLLTLDKKHILKMLKSYTFIIMLIGVYSIIEYFLEYNILYGWLYQSSEAISPSRISDMGYRVTTTIGHPLKNMTYFLFALPVSLCVFRKPFNYIASLFLGCSVLATGSRAGVILAVASLLLFYLHLYGNIFQKIKNSIIAISILLASYFLIFYSNFGVTVVSRFVGASDSAAIRVGSLSNIWNVISNNIIFGRGVGTSFEESTYLLNQKIGFENPWNMLIVDGGFIATLVYLGIIGVTIISKIKLMKFYGIQKTIYISFLTVLVMFSSYNSFGSRNTLNFLLWFIVALLFIGQEDNNREKIGSYEQL